MPQPIRHGLPDINLSSLGAMKSLQAGLPSNAKLERLTSGGPCPGIMPKPYPFRASDNPLWYTSIMVRLILDGAWAGGFEGVSLYPSGRLFKLKTE